MNFDLQEGLNDYAKACGPSDLVTCWDCEDQFHEDSMVVLNGHWFCETCKEHFHQCAKCGRWFREVFVCAAGCSLCETCFPEDEVVM